MNTVQLLGATDVRVAGEKMVSTAQDIANAASSMAQSALLMKQAQADMDYVLQNHQQFLDDWLKRFRRVFEEYAPTSRPEEPRHFGG